MLIDEDALDVTCSQPHPGENWEARTPVETDLTPVMPYINAVARMPEYYPHIPAIIWWREGRRVAVRPHELGIDEVPDAEAARVEIGRLAKWINDLWKRREEVAPEPEPKRPPPLMSVLKQLPMNNCGECGLPTCTAFAAALIKGDKKTLHCPALESEEWQSNARALRDMGLE